MAKRAVKSKIDKIASRAAKTKSPRRLKGRYAEMDLKATGALPTWDDVDTLTEEQLARRWRDGKYFYYYHHSVKELRSAIEEVYADQWSKSDVKLFKKIKDNSIPPNLACMCRLILDGARWPENSRAWADAKVAEMLEKERNTVEEIVEESKPVKKVVGIQDRLAEIRNDIVGELEEFEDEFIRTNKMPNTNILAWLRAKNVPQQIVPAIIALYEPRLAEMKLGREGKDAQLKEAYKAFKKKDWDAWIKWYENILNDLDAYRRVKVAARKTRVKKPVSPEKLVRKLKYLKEFEELGLKSVKPTEIVHAQQLWIYNVKTRKIGRYVASDLDKELTVKGSTILGWDPKQSVAKTLRKPQEQIKAFFGCGKVQLRTYLDNIKAVEVKLNGRINGQTILLKAIK